MKSITFILITLIASAITTATTYATEYLVTANVSMIFPVVSSTGAESLGKAKLTTEQFIQRCLELSETTEVTLTDVVLTFDSDYGDLHLIKKCDGSEVVWLGYSDYVEAYKASGSSDKVKRVSVLQFFNYWSFSSMEGSALGKESATYSDSGEKFKASFAGQAIVYEDFDTSVWILKLKTGAAFIPTGNCP